MLNQWEQSIVDRLRCGLQNRQSVTLGANEVHIAMNAIEERAKLTERAKAAEADMRRIHSCGAGCGVCVENGHCPTEHVRIGKCSAFKWRGPQQEGQEGAEHEQER